MESLSAYTYINMTLNKGKIRTVVHGLKPTILMVIAESILGGSNVLYKLAVNEGSDLRILVAYRFLFAAAFMIPIAFYVERSFPSHSLSPCFHPSPVPLSPITEELISKMISISPPSPFSLSLLLSHTHMHT